MSIFIKTNFDRCTGCGICQLACSMTLSFNNMAMEKPKTDIKQKNIHITDKTIQSPSLPGYNPRLSRLKIIHKRENLYHKPVVCNQCDNAYCMNVCPAKAYEKDDDGTVLIDPQKCVGCGLCVKYCPEGLIYLDPERKKAIKCDLCGGDPACVKACPTGALELAVRVENSALTSEEVISAPGSKDPLTSKERSFQEESREGAS